MRYTRVKVAACVLTASVMLYGSAVQIHATETVYDLPAAGVGLALEEGPSLASVQEEAAQSEKAAETVREVQETQAVTSADIESGVTGVGESTIDEKVVTHVQEQQMENAINNGIGVASILSPVKEQEEAPVPAAEDAGSLVVYNEEGGTVIVASSVDRMIVEPVDLKESQDSGEEADVSDRDEDRGETALPVESRQEETAESADKKKEESGGTEEKENKEEKKEENESKEEKEDKESKDKEEKESESEKETEEDHQSKDPDGVKDDQLPAETDTPAEEETDAEKESGSKTQESESKPAESENATTEEPVEQEPETPEETETPAAEEAAETPASESEAEASPENGETEAVPASTGAGNAVVDYALQFVGNPYSYGGSSLTNGTDCSGFVMSVYKNFGVSLPHSSSGDRQVGTEVGGGLANAQPGDIVCYSGHVGIYIGDNKIVHASTESTGIKVSEADYKTPITVRRVIN